MYSVSKHFIPNVFFVFSLFYKFLYKNNIYFCLIINVRQTVKIKSLGRFVSYCIVPNPLTCYFIFPFSSHL